MTYTDRQIRTFERLFCTLASNLDFEENGGQGEDSSLEVPYIYTWLHDDLPGQASGLRNCPRKGPPALVFIQKSELPSTKKYIILEERLLSTTEGRDSRFRASTNKHNPEVGLSP